MPSDAPSDAVDEALRAADVDELLRLVDRICSQRDWDDLARVHDRARRGHETGRQLWPVAAHAAYRLALEAPPAFAAAVLRDDEGRFAIGPLPEVAAQSSSWHDLAPHVPEGAAAVITLHERVVRGEDCADLPIPGPPVLELPTRLASWEPSYALATYHADRVELPSPPLPKLAPADLPAAPAREVDDVAHALLEVVRTWTTQSDGRADAVAVDGTALDAIAALGPRRVTVAPTDLATATAWLGWAGANGGARGRRAGAAAGRFAAWWVLATLAGSVDEFPPDPEELGADLADLRWLLWDAGEAGGWELHLAVEDPVDGRAWAIAAVDAAS